MVDEELVERDLTVKFGMFRPGQLVYFQHVRHIDISGCRHIQTDLFVDCLNFVKELKYLNISKCPQFSEGQICKIALSHLQLNVLDAHDGPELLFKTAYVILANCREFKTFNVEVKYPEAERKDWQHLILTFRQVLFGRAIQKAVF